jgi:hypothetical protein
MKSIYSVMGSPFHHLNPIQSLRYPGQGDIQDSDFPPGAAEMVPEGFPLDKFTGITSIEFISSRIDLG